MPEADVTLPTTLESIDEAFGLATLALADGRLLVPGTPETTGTARRVRIAASDVSLARERSDDSTILNALPTRILAAESSLMSRYPGHNQAPRRTFPDR